MFVEPHLNQLENKVGWIEVVCGSMFSGKTEELIRRMNRAKIAKQKVEIFKPSIDTRYDEVNVVSHNANAIRSTPVQSSSEIYMLAGDCDVVGIDEAQFFDNQIVEVCTQLANHGKRVIIAGLDMDFQGKPFGAMPELMTIAEFVTKVQAICMQCGRIAAYSYRLVSAETTVLLGEKESYEPRCRKCFNEGMKEQEKSRIKNHELREKSITGKSITN